MTEQIIKACILEEKLECNRKTYVLEINITADSLSDLLSLWRKLFTETAPSKHMIENKGVFPQYTVTPVISLSQQYVVDRFEFDSSSLDWVHSGARACRGDLELWSLIQPCLSTFEKRQRLAITKAYDTPPNKERQCLLCHSTVTI